MATSAPPPDQIPGANPIDRETALMLGVGAALALLSFAFQLSAIAFRGFTTLVHEMGHAIAGWIFACPSIPAFDLRYGGGITTIQDQDMWLMWVYYVAFAALLYFFRKNRLTLACLICLSLLHLICALTRLNHIIILAMGHGGELAFACLFLYRAWSNKTVAHSLERLLYAVVGWFVIFHDIHFAWRLAFSGVARTYYGKAKGGGHMMDFDRIAGQISGIELPQVALVFFVFTLLTPFVAYLVFRYETRIYCLIDRITAGGEF